MSKRDEAIKKIRKPYNWEPIDVGSQFTVGSTIMRCPQCGWRGVPTTTGGRDWLKCPFVGCDGKLKTFTTLSGDS